MNLKEFHKLRAWEQPDYDKRMAEMTANGDFMLGMVDPNTNKRMYNALDCDLDKYYFCEKTANAVVFFVENFLTHTKPSRFAKFTLHISQVKFFRNIYGWKKKADGFRRYSECFKYVPRKNSKSWDQGALCHIGMIIDGEQGVEIYNIAGDKAQAEKVFDPFVGSIKNDMDRPNDCASGFLAGYYNIHGRQNIKAVTANNELDFCKPVANNENAAHGGNAHYAICDEIHTFKDDGIYDVMVTSMSVRDQPLIVCITTADYAKDSFCNDKLDYAKRVCKDPKMDQRFLPILYYADPEEFGDDWQDPKVWLRVNPMLGVAKKHDYMEGKYTKALNEPAFTNKFKRLDLNICTSAENQAFNIDRWKKCGIVPDPDRSVVIMGQSVPDFLLKQKCYAGMDNAYKDDLNSLVLEFLDSGYVLNWNWIPLKHRNIVKFKEKHNDFMLTAGVNEIDFEEIYEHMQEIFKEFDIVEIGFDPNKSMEIRKLMSRDYPEDFIVVIAQNTSNLSEPIKKMIGDVNNMRMKHTGNSLFTEQVSGVDTKEDLKNDYMFIKPQGQDSKRKKVDACVAWSMAKCLRLQAETEIDWSDAIM